MILGDRVDLKTLASNQTDLVGTETTSTPTGMVSNSQVHYGELLKLFIEDQPNYRGNAAWNSVAESVLNGGIKLLVPNYSQNDFGDTHTPTFPQTLHTVYFGDGEGNSTVGGLDADHLYGGGGDDTLDGADGAGFAANDRKLNKRQWRKAA